MATTRVPHETLREVGLEKARAIHWNQPAPILCEETVRHGVGRIAEGGPLVVHTAPYTGRSPKDKYIVREPEGDGRIAWGPVNQPMDAARFEALYERLRLHLLGRDLYVQDLHAGADPAVRVSIRVVTESPWHALFARNLLLRIDGSEELAASRPAYTVLNAPSFKADPARDGTRTEAFVVLSFARKLILIGGTSYAGEIKKSVFTLLNYLLPLRGVFPMHCAANVGRANDVALFFGLSGTGKTTLSADPDRPLIGDDEHGWSDTGVFNFEGGCYAKVIRLDPRHEPEIYRASHAFGTVLENVILDETTRRLDLNSDAITENTRAAYPITHLPNVVAHGVAGHPTNVLFLTADAFGVLPPIARLSPPQAQYYFLSGYTAKVAGTERGVREPQATFSACFGEPFLPLPPRLYAEMLGERIDRHGPRVWLLNTGWTGGPHGAGHRIPIPHTRAMVRAILSGLVDRAEFASDPVFGLEVPRSVPDVPREVLSPRETWKDPAAYDAQALRLAGMFRENFARYAAEVPEPVRAAGPRA